MLSFQLNLLLHRQFDTSDSRLVVLFDCLKQKEMLICVITVVTDIDQAQAGQNLASVDDQI